MIRVRPARSEDVPRLTEIARHSITAGHWKQEAYAKLFETEAAQSSRSFVVEENQCVMGFLVGQELSGGEWEIENVAIMGTARRRGLGSRLLGEFLDLVRSRGGTDVYLEVRESNRAARALYEKWGFLETGVRKSYYQGSEENALIFKFSFPQGS
jgi:ribosomal-protein-alanine N-acetyltransferase